VYEEVHLRFTTASPGARTGWRYRARQRPVPGEEQPPPVRRARILFPPGTVIDTGAVIECEASDDEIRTRGLEACPRSSRLGGGSGTLYIGIAERVKVVLAFFNAKDAVLFTVATQSGAVLRTIRFGVRGRVLDSGFESPTTLPGGREAALTSVSLDVRAAGRRSRPWLRTPRRCPRRGAWRFVYDISYDEPWGRQRPYDLSRCNGADVGSAMTSPTRPHG
jgi:hypothetical protein